MGEGRQALVVRRDGSVLGFLDFDVLTSSYRHFLLVDGHSLPGNSPMQSQ